MVRRTVYATELLAGWSDIAEIADVLLASALPTSFSQEDDEDTVSDHESANDSIQEHSNDNSTVHEIHHSGTRFAPLVPSTNPEPELFEEVL